MNPDTVPQDDAEHVLGGEQKTSLRVPADPEERAHCQPGLGPDLDAAHTRTKADLQRVGVRWQERTHARTEEREHGPNVP